MKKLQLYVTSFMIFGFLFATALSAQEQTEVTVVVKKEGKVVKDTTYSFDDTDKADHFIMMADALSHGEKGYAHMKVVHEHLNDCGEGHGKTKVYVIKTEGDEGMKTFDTLEDDDNVKVIKIEEDGEVITIIETEDGDEKQIEVKIIKTGEGEGEWTVNSDEDEDIIIIKQEKKIIKEEAAPEEKGEKAKK